MNSISTEKIDLHAQKTKNKKQKNGSEIVASFTEKKRKREKKKKKTKKKTRNDYLETRIRPLPPPHFCATRRGLSLIIVCELLDLSISDTDM